MGSDPGTGKRYKHEEYSAAVVTELMRDVIEDHPHNQNYRIKAEDVAALLTGNPRSGRSLIWRSLIAGQLDADRADYLLRDSHHIGVAYGHFDLDRLIATLTVVLDPETSSPGVAVEEGGVHAAEALIIARYMMFTQVYFQHTRRAYDHHSVQAIRHLLDRDSSGGTGAVFPPPMPRQNLEKYLRWDDWRVLGLISEGEAGEHGDILKCRTHYRRVFETPEIPSLEDGERCREIRDALAQCGVFTDRASNSWYRFESAEVPLLERSGSSAGRLVDLSSRSAVVKGLKSVARTRLYVPEERRCEADGIVQQIRMRGKGLAL